MSGEAPNLGGSSPGEHPRDVHDTERTFVSRGGIKLHAALRAFNISVAGWACADFGSNVGGFVDCLLRAGASSVFAIDPGYGILDYKLRTDPRVIVCERKNALHFMPPRRVDLVTIDVGWTKQRLILPATSAWLRPGGIVISLIKPHYEAPKRWLSRGVLRAENLPEVLSAVRADAATSGFRVESEIESPIEGHGGNREWLWLLRAAEGSSASTG